METLFNLEDIENINTSPQVEVKQGDIWQLGRHRLLCGDCTIKENVDLLMNGNKADMVFTDPPYGMGKAIYNDDLNSDDLIDFHKNWIAISFEILKDNGSWYCWNNDIGVLNIYSEILKPLIKDKKLTFRNIITWDKGSGQGQNSPVARMYATADEKCLFVMKGIQGFDDNAYNYFEGFEPIRQYLRQCKEAMGWTNEIIQNILQLSSNRFHFLSKSQWSMITESNYNKLKAEAEKQRKEKNINNNAFCKEYSAFHKEYFELKKEYDKIKQEFYNSRAYFHNTHDNFNNVWHFYRVNNKKKMLECSGHDTPKPIELCERGIKTSSRENEIICDLFLGSGSTLIACERNNRICYGMEIDEYYCEYIIKRWQKYTNKKAIKIKGV